MLPINHKRMRRTPEGVLMSLWVLPSVILVSAFAGYLFVEDFRELLLDVVADSLHWIVPCVIVLACGLCFYQVVLHRPSPRPVPSSRVTSSPPLTPDLFTPAATEANETVDDGVPHTEPERQARLRVVIVEAPVPGTEQYPALFRQLIEAQFEKHFRTAGIGLLADEQLRARIVIELQRVQEARALYDPATLQRVGDFHGATHGAFWSLTKSGVGWQLQCRLVRFRTSEVLATASSTFANADSIGATVQETADLLLSDIAEVTILSPVESGVCSRRIVVSGRARYMPRTWTLWLTLLPDTISAHYPQMPVTVQRNDEWLAPEVYLGDENLLQSQAFTIYAVLTDAEYSQRMRDYIDRADNGGIDVSKWPRQHYKLVSHVTVTRKPAAARMGCSQG